ncbi:DUF6379 domain-containing protein [Sphingomonas sp. R647]|uniref:C-glycoside deglycosidase beta subunit domain-containing protein n=1 Tax=Sphingomonas sp. R647 TaxID=2875233 RepID=UPI001CD1B12C|nr:DUF6379 domain-containing protein [Sphingomonas sp. R647]MCA1197734.1 DUF6379 domain-containing protein [Sphingomonas sp. R647]
MGKIKRGVSLYSYQNETFQGKMTLEDCIRTSAEFGAHGIEIIGEQSFWGWPEVGVEDAAIDNWHQLIAKYDCVPSVDGEKIAREDVRFSVRGKTYALDEMETVYDDRWNFGEKARIIALKPGGRAPGNHRIEFAVRMRVSYLPFVPTTKDSKELALAA